MAKSSKRKAPSKKGSKTVSPAGKLSSAEEKKETQDTEDVHKVLSNLKQTGVSKYGSKFRYAFKWRDKVKFIGSYITQEEAVKARSIFLNEFEAKLKDGSEEAAKECALNIVKKVMNSSDQHTHNLLSNLKGKGIHKNDSKYRYTFYWKGKFNHIGNYLTLEEAEKTRDLFLKEFESKLQDGSEEAAKDHACNMVRYVKCREQGISKCMYGYLYTFRWKYKRKHVGVYDSFEEAVKAREAFLEHFELKLGDASVEDAIEYAFKLINEKYESNDCLGLEDHEEVDNNSMEMSEAVKHALDVSSISSLEDIVDKKIEDNDGERDLPEHVQKVFQLV